MAHIETTRNEIASLEEKVKAMEVSLRKEEKIRGQAEFERQTLDALISTQDMLGK